MSLLALQFYFLSTNVLKKIFWNSVENAIKEECSDDQIAIEKECTSDENDRDYKKKGKLNDRAYKVKGKHKSKQQNGSTWIKMISTWAREVN